MVNHDTAIRVENVSKTFKLPHSKNDSIKSKLISLKDRQRGYEIQQALKDVSFEVKKGEFFGIVGRNGSGKSTLLKLISGIYSPDSGSIHVSGKLTPFIELGVGFNPELSGRDNVFLNGSLLGFNRKEMEAMYDEIVEFAELERFMDQKLKNYSSGMQVRLAFSIAVRANSDILLLDEVLAVGDINFQKKCFEYFKELKTQNKTVILVTHTMSTVKEFCDNAILIDSNKIVPTNGVDEVLEKYMDIMNPERNSVAHKDSEQSDIEIVGQKVTTTDDIITLEFTLDYKKHASREIGVAACIKDTINTAILKYNSLYESPRKLFTIQPGKNTLKLEFHNYITDGNCFVDLALTDNQGNGISVFDDVAKFSLKQGRKSVTRVRSIKQIELKGK